MFRHNQLLTSLLITLTISNFLHSFNPLYTGTNPYESYATMWGNERFDLEDYVKYFPHYKPYVETIAHTGKFDGDFSKLPYPYNQLSEITAFFPGPNYYDNYEYIAQLFAHNSLVKTVEIGSAYGLSTRHIASLLPDNGYLYAIDVWEWTSEGYLHQRYVPFLSNVIHTGLTDKIYPIKARSDQALLLFKLTRQTFDFIYVDGAHDTQGVLADLELYFPMLNSTGVMCGDDWLLTSVRTAVVQFAQQHNLTIYKTCNFWMFKQEGQYQQKEIIGAPEDIWNYQNIK